MKKLQDIMNLIDSQYVFNEENYPALKNIGGNEITMFAIQHSLLHMQKDLGKIATACEAYDHTRILNHKTLTEIESATVNTLINTLKLASLLGFSAEGLLEEVEKKFKK